MANPNPSQARAAKKAKRRGKPGTLEDARRLLWKALTRAGDILDGEDLDPALTLKALHGISQGAAAYARIVEVGELEARLTALEGLQGGEDEAADGGPRLSRGAA